MSLPCAVVVAGALAADVGRVVASPKVWVVLGGVTLAHETVCWWKSGSLLISGGAACGLVLHNDATAFLVVPAIVSPDNVVVGALRSPLCSSASTGGCSSVPRAVSPLVACLTTLKASPLVSLSRCVGGCSCSHGLDWRDPSGLAGHR